ncbi:MAG: GyrI-like domain-containing protein [Bacteroidetes bacterium]|nr:GyrI-like domain-containing protein [Bacteroidota bacterium]
MFLRVENIPAQKLVGKSLTMSFANDRTVELWRSFMPDRFKIIHRLNDELLNMQVYSTQMEFENFNPELEFEKWAVAEVSEFGAIPEGMKTYTLSGGLYAVFLHKGDFREFNKTIQFIYGSWLPSSGYERDTREHFERLGAKYLNNHPDSEEEVWIPIR